MMVSCKESSHDFVPGNVMNPDGLGMSSVLPGMVCRRCGYAMIARVENPPGVLTDAIVRYIDSKIAKKRR